MTPIYLYQCMDEHTHTRIESMDDAPERTDCPRCNRPAKRIIAQPSRPIVKGGTPIHHRADE